MKKNITILLFVVLIIGCKTTTENGIDSNRTLNEVEALAIDYYETIEDEGPVSIGRFLHPIAFHKFRTIVIDVVDKSNNIHPNYKKKLRSLDSELLFFDIMNTNYTERKSFKTKYNNFQVLDSYQENGIYYVNIIVTERKGLSRKTQENVLRYSKHNEKWMLLPTKEIEEIQNKIQKKGIYFRLKSLR